MNKKKWKEKRKKDRTDRKYGKNQQSKVYRNEVKSFNAVHLF